MKKFLVYSLLTIILFISGYFFLRLAYNTNDQFPFTQEVISVMLCIIGTVSITALLISRQTEAELNKEQVIKYIELKSSIYLEIINKLEEFSVKQNLKETDLKKFEFFTHKLALVASYLVIEAYNSFLTDIAGTISDKTISSKDSNFIAERLAILTLQMREDLIGDLDKKTETARIRSLIISNTRKSIENFKAIIKE